MKQLFTFLFILFFFSCQDSGDQLDIIDYTGNIESDLSKYFIKNEVVVDIMDGIKASPRQVELSSKFQTGIRENYNWFMEYIQSIQEGESMPYHPNLGMSREEYDEFRKMLDNVEAITTGKELIVFHKVDSVITISAKGKLENFQNLRFNLKENSVYYQNKILPFEPKNSSECIRREISSDL